MKNEGETRDSGALSAPLSFLRSGDFYWSDAGLYYRGGYGNYWSLRSYSTTYSNRLYFDATNLGPQLNSHRGNGFAVRCVAASIGNSSLTLGEIASRLRTYNLFGRKDFSIEKSSPSAVRNIPNKVRDVRSLSPACEPTVRILRQRKILSKKLKIFLWYPR